MYRRPTVNQCDILKMLDATTQYILNITMADCPGQAGGKDSQLIAYRNGDEYLIEKCLNFDLQKGIETDLKCLETGDQNYNTVIVDVSPGSIQCDLGQHPVIMHVAVDSSLPPVCTKTSEIMDDMDLCHP